jgi:hypothetical protein
VNMLTPRSGITLRVLTALFAARVVGQALVAYLDVTWLPARESWSSGLLPYRCCCRFARPRPHAGRVLQWISCVYARFATVSCCN